LIKFQDGNYYVIEAFGRFLLLAFSLSIVIASWIVTWNVKIKPGSCGNFSTKYSFKCAVPSDSCRISRGDFTDTDISWRWILACRLDRRFWVRSWSLWRFSSICYSTSDIFIITKFSFIGFIVRTTTLSLSS
jgi:hypothetical protein